MSRLTNYLDTKLKKKDESKISKSLYYSYKDKYIRVSDHLQVSDIKYDLQIIQISASKYIVIFSNKLLLLESLGEVKNFMKFYLFSIDSLHATSNIKLKHRDISYDNEITYKKEIVEELNRSIKNLKSQQNVLKLNSFMNSNNFSLTDNQFEQIKKLIVTYNKQVK